MSLNKKGQALIEYILIVVVISIIVIALVSFFGGYAKDAITKTSCSLIGNSFTKGEKPGEGTCSEVLKEIENKTSTEVSSTKTSSNESSSEESDSISDENDLLDE